jgi:hypothetical protein
MKLNEVLAAEGIFSLPTNVCIGRFANGRKLLLRSPDFTKADDGNWYAGDLKFIPAIAKTGDLEKALVWLGQPPSPPKDK